MATSTRNRVRRQLSSIASGLIIAAAENENDTISEQLPKQYAVISTNIMDGTGPTLVKAFISRRAAIGLRRRFNRAADLVGKGGYAQVFRIRCRIAALPNFPR